MVEGEKRELCETNQSGCVEKRVQVVEDGEESRAAWYSKWILTVNARWVKTAVVGWDGWVCERESVCEEG